MTNSEVAAIRKGDRFIDEVGVRWTATTDAKAARESTNYEVWMLSLRKTQVLRVSHHNAGHLTLLKEVST